MGSQRECQVLDYGTVLVLRTEQGNARFHSIWLRDNAVDATTRDVGNGQRLISLNDIPASITITRARFVGNGDDDHAKLQLTFSPKNETIEYDIEWLMRHKYDNDTTSTHTERQPGWVGVDCETWDVSLAKSLTRYDFRTVLQTPIPWLQQIARYGFAKLSGGPVRDRALFEVVALFGFVRETNYGRMFEVRVHPNPSNHGYTSLALQPHTDNPYRDPVPTLLVLYCLRSSNIGGESTVVDGFRVAQRLRSENQHWFYLLSQHNARFEYAGERGVMLQSKKPMIEVGVDGELRYVRFNNRSCSPITDVPFEKMTEYYRAYRRFLELTEDPTMEIAFKLEPGDCVVFDNTRVLHSRKSFSGGEGRWMQGCYADKDGLLSMLAAARSHL